MKYKAVTLLVIILALVYIFIQCFTQQTSNKLTFNNAYQITPTLETIRAL